MPPTEIVVTMLLESWKANLKIDPRVKEYGHTKAEAIGKLILLLGEMPGSGLKIETVK